MMKNRIKSIVKKFVKKIPTALDYCAVVLKKLKPVISNLTEVIYEFRKFKQAYKPCFA